MILLLVLAFLIIIGFGIGIDHSKKAMITSIVVFLIIMLTSFLMTFIFPIEWFMNVKFPLINQSIAQYIKSMEGLEGIINTSPSLGDGIIDYITNISRLFIMPFFAVLMYLILGIVKLIKIIKFKKNKIAKEKPKKINYLGGAIQSVKYIVIFSVIVAPISFVTKTYEKADEVAGIINYSVCQNENDCSTMNMLSNDIIINQIGKSLFFDKYSNKISKNRINELNKEMSDLEKIVKLLRVSGLDTIFDVGFEFSGDSTKDIKTPVLEELLTIALDSELFGQVIVDMFNNILKDFGEKIKEDHPNVRVNELYYTKATLKREIKELAFLMDMAFEKNLFSLSKHIDIEVIYNLINDMSMKELNNMIRRIESIRLIERVNKYVNVADTTVKWLIATLTSYSLITGIYIFETMLTMSDESLIEFRKTAKYIELQRFFE